MNDLRVNIVGRCGTTISYLLPKGPGAAEFRQGLPKGCEAKALAEFQGMASEVRGVTVRRPRRTVRGAMPFFVGLVPGKKGAPPANWEGNKHKGRKNGKTRYCFQETFPLG